ncbi:hypothetical protein BX666DRAFT_2052907 [Dichotomocladium elegans]|nr:hypothetical protein BX666DRAFT_2052907 [Dichotomocladium elegans]
MPVPPLQTYGQATAPPAQPQAIGTPPNPTHYQHQQQSLQPSGSQQAGYQQGPPKPKPKIDPTHIPSPVQMQQANEAIFLTEHYGTCSQQTIPLSTTDHKTIDQGNCNPRFMRATLREIPKSPDLVRDTHLPFGLVVQPLAKLHPEDEPVPLATTTGEDGPIRCSRCKGYINPACQFTDGGRKFNCNLCGFTNDVPEHYFSHLDMAGQRMDLDQRPELRLGSVEFEVPEVYWTRQPSSLRVLFAVDVSFSAIQSGMVETFCAALQLALFSDATFPPGTRIGIVTFDSAVHFYNLSATLEQAQMLVVPDVNDMFLPLSDDAIFVDPHASRSVIENLLSSLPSLFAGNRQPTSVFGSAVKAGMMSLQATGGKIHVLQTTLPTAGIGMLKNRDNPKLYGTDKERQLLSPQDAMYTTIGKECVDLGICVDLWCFPLNTYIDVCTLGVIPALTGGDTHFYPNFARDRDDVSFTDSLINSLSREQGYNAAMRVRCSNGLAVDEQFGNFYMNNSTDVELAGVDADKSVAFSLRHDGKLDEGDVHFQCALLYTTKTGHRRVRLHNLRIPATNDINTIFRQADLDTSMNVLSKQVISQTPKKLQQDLVTLLDGECTRILAAYRKHCASSAASGQLILPESFKTLPVYILSLKKSTALRRDMMVGADMRVYSMRRFKSLGVSALIRWLYPRMVNLHEYLTVKGKISIVPLQRLSYDLLHPKGMYLLEGPEATYLWIGQHVDAALLQSLFGVAELNEVNPKMAQMPPASTPQAERLAALLQRSPSMAPLRVIRQGFDHEGEFMNMLVEDETHSQMSYVDYLCMIHKQIQSEVEPKRK